MKLASLLDCHQSPPPLDPIPMSFLPPKWTTQVEETVVGQELVLVLVQELVLVLVPSLTLVACRLEQMAWG